ncbi:MAG: hypothetical protein ACRD4E_14555, partial [Bryobacteraceae bacterium]
PGHPLAKSLSTLIRDKHQDENVSSAMSKAREFQVQGNPAEAINELDKVLALYPLEARLIKLRASLSQTLTAEDRDQLRTQDLTALQQLAQESKETSDPRELRAIFQKSNRFAKYEGDSAFQETISAIEERLRQKQTAETVAMAAPEAARSVAAKNEQPPAEVPPPPPERVSAKSVSAKSAPRSSVNVKVIGGVAAAVVLALAAWGVRSHSNAQRAADARTLDAKKVPVHVTIDADAVVKVVDRNGSDVTDDLEYGLGSGDYRLTASRAGFAPITQSFSIQPTDPERSLDLKWVALPTQLRVMLAGSTGTLKINNVIQSLDGSELKKDLSDGQYSIQWGSSDKDFMDIELEVKQTSANIMKPTFQGSPGVSGLAAALSLKSVSFQTINLNGGITKSIGGQAEKLGSDGSFDITRGQTISFAASRFNGRTLGDMYADPGGQPAVYIYLIPPSGGRSGKSKPNQPGSGNPPDASAASVQPQQPPQPPKLSDSELKAKQEEERREQIRKKLGIKGGDQK